MVWCELFGVNFIDIDMWTFIVWCDVNILPWCDMNLLFEEKTNIELHVHQLAKS